MAKNASLKATARDGQGKGAARKLRGTGRIPAVLYGRGETPRPLSVDGHELTLLVHAISVENTVVKLEIEGEKAQDVLLREVQMHAYKPEVLHVDFFHLHAGEKLTLKIPVRLLGTPYGVHTEGGVLDHVLYDLEVECLPRNIPDVVEVDVSELKVGESVRVNDVTVPDARILHDGELPIASVVAPRLVVDETDEPAEADEAAEPELVGRDDEDQAEEE